MLTEQQLSKLDNLKRDRGTWIRDQTKLTCDRTNYSQALIHESEDKNRSGSGEKGQAEARCG
jgi:hypothetical protein